MTNIEGEKKSWFKETLKRVGIVAVVAAGVIFLVSESGLVMSAGVSAGPEDFGVKAM